MADIKMINNYNIKDETARNEIEALRGQIPTVPTNVSDFTNDAGYLVGSDVEKYATKDNLNDAIGDINTILDSILGEEI